MIYTISLWHPPKNDTNVSLVKKSEEEEIITAHKWS